MDRFNGPPEKRFWAKVNKDSNCWEWTAYVNAWGYGVFNIGNKKLVLAHRYAWSLVNGKIPDGMLVLHHCDNPKCVRPEHLFIGTNADNMKDMVEKGRSNCLRGEDQPLAKLTYAKAEQIRELYGRGDISQSKIAEMFSVSQVLVSKVVNRMVW